MGYDDLKRACLFVCIVCLILIVGSLYLNSYYESKLSNLQERYDNLSII
jgi:hypothetical protein